MFGIFKTLWHMFVVFAVPCRPCAQEFHLIEIEGQTINSNSQSMVHVDCECFFSIRGCERRQKKREKGSWEHLFSTTRTSLRSLLITHHHLTLKIDKMWQVTCHLRLNGAPYWNFVRVNGETVVKFRSILAANEAAKREGWPQAGWFPIIRNSHNYSDYNYSQFVRNYWYFCDFWVLRRKWLQQICCRNCWCCWEDCFPLISLYP